MNRRIKQILSGDTLQAPIESEVQSCLLVTHLKRKSPISLYIAQAIFKTIICAHRHFENLLQIIDHPGNVRLMMNAVCLAEETQGFVELYTRFVVV